MPAKHKMHVTRQIRNADADSPRKAIHSLFDLSRRLGHMGLEQEAIRLDEALAVLLKEHAVSVEDLMAQAR